MAQQRLVRTEHGDFAYTLVRKNVKRLNLRIHDSGAVFLSVPVRCTHAQADAFIMSKSGWIMEHRKRIACDVQLLPELSREDAGVLLLDALEKAYLLVEVSGVPRPRLKIRKMRSQWGNCHWEEGYVTLNVALHRCPEHLRVYVALHELVHLLHHNHGAGFYAVMDKLMPQWKEHRKELQNYACSIRK